MDWSVNCRLDSSWRTEDKSENCSAWTNTYLMYENLLEKQLEVDSRQLCDIRRGSNNINLSHKIWLIMRIYVNGRFEPFNPWEWLESNFSMSSLVVLLVWKVLACISQVYLINTSILRLFNKFVTLLWSVLWFIMEYLTLRPRSQKRFFCLLKRKIRQQLA